MTTLVHVNIHKAASSWFRELFRDPILKPLINKPILHYETDLRKGTYQDYCRPSPCHFPHNSFVTNICCGYHAFQAIPKEGDYRGFVVYRDPRDLIVSNYWSWLKSHPGGHPNRTALENLSFEEGMVWVINELDLTLNTFQAMLEWHCECHDPNILKVKYEDFFTGPENEPKNLSDLFEFLRIGLHPDTIDQLYAKYKFESMSQGRPRGDVNNASHFRAGVSGRHKTDLPHSSLEYFLDVYPNILRDLGYEEDKCVS